jgi:hypothetical protein
VKRAPALSLFALACASLLGAPGCSDSRGEVMVVVTTDMSLPGDLDRLRWRVYRDGAVASNGELALTSFDSLPATLSIAGSEEQAVRVEIEGLRDGKTRVRRSAAFELPDEGVKALRLPLNFLCSDALGDESCGTGATCQAGRCVPEAQDSKALPTFDPLPSGACFDAAACIVGKMIALPTPLRDRDSNDCVLTGGSLSGDGNVNVAIVVDTPVVGNYGVCGAGASCVVPLEPGVPEGWKLNLDDRDRLLSISLPEVICEELGHSVLRLQTAMVSPDCPMKDPELPLCDAPSACIAADIGCPDGWDSWTCTGSAQPVDIEKEYRYCGQLDLDPSRSPFVPGHWCCAPAEPEPPRPERNPLLIDDMSGGSQVKLASPPGFVAGGWYSETDDTRYPISPPPYPALFTYRESDLPREQPPGAPALSRAACLTSKSGYEGTFALAGFNYLLDRNNFLPAEFDVSAYTGVRFWAAAPNLRDGEPLSLRVNFPNTQTYTEANTECVKRVGKQACDHFGADLLLTNRWRQYFVRWDELGQSPRDLGQVRFDEFAPRLYSTDFMISGGGSGVTSQPFDFCISQIYFTTD